MDYGGRNSKVFLICNVIQFRDAKAGARSFYDRDTIVVAKELLGKLLIHHSRGVKRVGKIVEVEAYLGPHDLAAHSAKGLTKRTQVMFGPPGHAYVYLIYGMYHCMNVVTSAKAMHRPFCCAPLSRWQMSKVGRKARACFAAPWKLTGNSTPGIC